MPNEKDSLSVFCVQASAIQQFVLPTEIIRSNSKLGHATIVVDELEKKRRDSDSVVTDEIYLFRNLVHEIHKMGMLGVRVNMSRGEN